MHLTRHYEFINNLGINLYFTPVIHISVSVITIWIDFLLYIYMMYFIHYLLIIYKLQNKKGGQMVTTLLSLTTYGKSCIEIFIDI